MYDDSFFRDLEVVGVNTVGAFDILRMVRSRESLHVSLEYVDVYVTNRESVLGAGVLTRVRSRWDRRTDQALERLLARGLISAERANALVGEDTLGARMRVTCGDECSAQWLVMRGSDEVTIDAATGETLDTHDPSRHFSGTTYTQGALPGNGGGLVTTRLRGANIVRGAFATNVGSTDRTTGAYNFTAAAPWVIDMNGGRNGAVWPKGRVDRRVGLNPPQVNTIDMHSQAWDPSVNANPSITYALNRSTLVHGEQIAYGWFSYWQDLFRVGVGVEVPDTHSFVLSPWDDIGGRTYALGAAPGSGQSSWTISTLTWPTNDDVPPDFDDWMSAFAHEYGHTIQMCAEGDGNTCVVSSAASSPSRPPIAADWRIGVTAAYVENLASFFGAALDEFHSSYNGGSNYWVPDWTYGGYTDTTDSFANWAEDSASLLKCDSSTHCPPGFACMPASEQSPYAPPPTGTSCVRLCATDNDCRSSGGSNINAANTCQPVCTCANASDCPSSTVACVMQNGCGASGYLQQWFLNVGTRLTFDTGWSTSLLLTSLASIGMKDNGMRDFNLDNGADHPSWYTLLADIGINVAAVTRAVRSVTDQPGLTNRDDFADSLAEALPISVLNGAGTSLVWGSGAGLYPNIDWSTDSDWFLFRGIAGSRYTITATPRPGSSVDLSASVYRATVGTLVATGSAPTGPTTALTAGPLPASDWYAIKITTRVPTVGAYTVQVQLSAQTDDDVSNSTQEALPLASGIAYTGYLTTSDVDRFQIHVPSTSGSFQVITSSSPSATVEVFSPSGSSLGTGIGSVTLQQPVVAAAGVGYYLVDVRDTSGVARGYTLTVAFSCANWSTSSCDDQSSTNRATRYTWGDRFAGRIPYSSATANYLMTLNNAEGVTVSLTDYSSTCRYTLDLVPPPTMAMFGGQPVWLWTDDNNSGMGSGASNSLGSRRGPGGHFYAPIGGQYKIVVHQTAGSNCSYRLNVARTGYSTAPRPAW